MNRQRGFTLIEVVVAFALLALVLTTAFEIFSTGLARAGQLDDRAKALVIAQSRMAAAGVEEALKEGESQGESEDRHFRWTQSVKRMEDPVEPGKPVGIYALYRIDVRVTWHDPSSREQAIALSTVGIWTRGA